EGEAGERRTRHRLLEAATVAMAKGHGVPGLLATAAGGAGCTIDRARIFFRRDEDLVLALYARFAADLEGRAADLAGGTRGQRFEGAVAAKLELVRAYRRAMAGLTRTLLSPRHELGVLNPQTEVVRIRVQGVFSLVVRGASDGPQRDSPRLERALYGLHLLLMGLWAHDPTPGSAATRGLLWLSRGLLRVGAPALRGTAWLAS